VNPIVPASSRIKFPFADARDLGRQGVGEANEGTMGMSNRMAIQWAITEYVSDSVACGVEIDVTTAALQLSTKYPQSGYTLDDICTMIEEIALSDGNAVAADRVRQRPSPEPDSESG
jgi:hypothetical protein